MSSKPVLNLKSGSILLIAAALVLQLVFFAPMQVLLQNFGEFAVRFRDIFLLFLGISMVLVFLVYALVRILKIPVLPAFITFLSTVVFLESRFFLSFAGHQPFDGKQIDWQPLQWLSWLELGVIGVLAVVFLMLYKQTRFFSLLSLFILIFVTGGFAFTMFWNTDVVMDKRQVNTTESSYFEMFHELSDQRNVIHIVPDQTQGAMLHDILSSDTDRYAAVFDGFTLFTQATGQYQSTYPSVLFYMTGEAPVPETDLTLNQPFTWDYIAETLEEKSIVTLLSDNGFNTFGFQFHPGIFCKGSYTACIGTHDEVFAGVAVNNSEHRFMMTVMTALDIALFQSTPIVLRKNVYDDGQWFIKKLDRNLVTHSGVLDTFSKELRVDAQAPSYNYFHHAGAHAPLLFDKECNYVGLQEGTRENQQAQVGCTLNQFEDLIKALKKAKVYDQTMIVINGDHGTPWLPPSYSSNHGSNISEAMMGTASTFVLIKPFASRGPMLMSDKAVTIGDIPITIADALDLDSDYEGVRMFRDDPGKDRERQYFTYESASRTHSLQELPNLTRYRIRGDVFDENDWVLPNSHGNRDTFSQLRMDDPDFDLYAQGFSGLEQHNVPMRWVDGKLAGVMLEPPGEGSMALVFESYVPPAITGQWVEVFVAGKFIARLEEEDLKRQRHIISIPHDIPRTELMELEFKMGKTHQFGEDLRQLSVMFAYIGLEPTG